MISCVLPPVPQYKMIEHYTEFLFQKQPNKPWEGHSITDLGICVAARMYKMGNLQLLPEKERAPSDHFGIRVGSRVLEVWVCTFVDLLWGASSRTKRPPVLRYTFAFIPS